MGDDQVAGHGGPGPAAVSESNSHVDVWAVDLDDWHLSHSRHESPVAEDGAAAARLRSPLAARRLLARRGFVRSVLGIELGRPAAAIGLVRSCQRCGSSEHGRPELVGGEVNFSVSSSGGVAVVAVPGPGRRSADVGAPIGIDIEEIVPGADRPTSVLTPDELATLGSLATDERDGAFLRSWTAKEAVLKAAERTVADNPATVDARDRMVGRSGRVRWAGTEWYVEEVDIPPVDGIATVTTVATRDGAAVTVRWVDGRPVA